MELPDQGCLVLGFEFPLEGEGIVVSFRAWSPHLKPLDLSLLVQPEQVGLSVDAVAGLAYRELARALAQLSERANDKARQFAPELFGREFRHIPEASS